MRRAGSIVSFRFGYFAYFAYTKIKIEFIFDREPFKAKRINKIYLGVLHFKYKGNMLFCQNDMYRLTRLILFICHVQFKLSII